MKYRWSVAPPQPVQASRLAASLNLAPLLAQGLINRDVTDPQPAERFLDPRLKHLADPFLLPETGAAVERLFCALERKERLVVFGDYDVDGVTSTALLTEVLTVLGWQVNSYLPHRIDEGYGLSQDAVENCLKKFPVTLLLAVDCGSTARETIQWLGTRGVDVIVLDHHQVSRPAPKAVALVNPQVNPPAFTELCSAGLAFKLAHALVKRGREMNWPAALALDLRDYLDLVALGTVADIVPLVGENRILVSTGLQRLDVTPRPGLVALKAVAQTAEPIGVHEIGFQLAPRLNAAGRLETADEALRLMLCRDPVEADRLAQSLDLRNRERQQIERSIVEQVAGAVRARFNPETDYCIVEGQLFWHIGVVGIVASRVLQEFHRPTVILGGDSHEWRGSGRSIEGFDLAAALGECGDLLLRHGGHAMAAGLSMRPENCEAFRARLNEIARRTLSPEQLKPELRIDAEVSLADLTFDLMVELERLKPTGPANPEIKFLARGLRHSRPPQRIGKEKQHAKLRVTDGSRRFEALWWNCGTGGALPEGTFDMVFAPQLNKFEGLYSVQLRVLDWRRV